MKKYGWKESNNPDLIHFLNDNMSLIADKLIEMQVIEQANPPKLPLNN